MIFCFFIFSDASKSCVPISSSLKKIFNLATISFLFIGAAIGPSYAIFIFKYFFLALGIVL